MEKKTKAALIYDFDGTLSPGNMQEYGFIAAVGKSNEEFWHESNVLAEDFDADPILSYMLKMLEHASKTNIPIKREDFQATGRNIKLYKGVESWFERINRYGAERGIEILHYINSSGLKEIIEALPLRANLRKSTPANSSTTTMATPIGPPWLSTTPTRRSLSTKSTRASIA
jgi:hypothetical protein